MANQKNLAHHSKLAPFALVYWKKDNNWRAQYGDTNDIRNSLAERTWLPHYNVSVVPIPDSEKKEAVALRKERWEALKAAAKGNQDAAAELSVFEQLFVKNGKIVEPEFSGNAGFRRASAFEAAMVQRFKDDTIPPDEKIVDTVPILVKHYDDEIDRIIDQQLENELKDVGTKKMDDSDRLRIAKHMYDLGAREVKLRKLYKDTTGQKLFGICQLNNNFPTLQIYQRLLLPDNDPAHLPYRKIRHDSLIRFNNRFEADRKRREKLPLTDKERQLDPLPESEVVTYLDSLRTGGEGNAEKIMAKKEIDSLAKQTPVHFFRVPLMGVMKNQSADLAPYIPYVEQLNLHKSMIDEGKGNVAGLGLTVASKAPGVVERVAALLVDKTPQDVLNMLTPAVSNNGSVKPAPVPASSGS